MGLIKALLDWLKSLFYGIGAREADAYLDESLAILNDWLGRLQRGELMRASALSIVDKARAVRDRVRELYGIYVPPFKPELFMVPSDVIDSLERELRSRARYYQRAPADGVFYTVSKEDFLRIVQWDWTRRKRYLAERFDCDDFSLWFKERMAGLFEINAVGVVFDYSAGHAYNLVILREGDGYKWYLFEPQTGSLFTYDERDQGLYKMEFILLIL